MNDSWSRRGFLGGLSATAVTATLGGRARAVVGRPRVRGDAEHGFDPASHGFGFVNWSSSSTRFPEHDHDAVTEAEIRTAILDGWGGPLRRVGIDLAASPELVETIARQVYVSANQLSASNGHCYGMTYAAQRYFERPDEVPLGRPSASAFSHPEVPVDEPGKGPVATDVDALQTSQLLDPNAWIGRRGLLAPELIDLDRQLGNLRAVLDDYGTAGITLVDSSSARSHQVLAYDARRRNGRTAVAIYDPNQPASDYADGPRTLTLGRDVGGTPDDADGAAGNSSTDEGSGSAGDAGATPAEGDGSPDDPADGEGTDGGVRMVPYGEYDTFLFNSRERIADARGEATPAPAFGVPAARLADLLRRPAVFTVDSSAVRLVVLDPTGRPLGRDWATFVDRARTPVHGLRYRYGASGGRYRVLVAGRADADYRLRVDAAASGGALLRESVDASIRAGEVHHYEARVPSTPDDSGALRRVDDWSRELLAGAGALALGAVGGAYLLGRRGD